MNRKELSEKVAKENCISTAQADRLVVSVFKAIADGLANPAEDREPVVSIPGFGVFKTKTRAAGIRRNPRTGAMMNTPETKVVRLTVSKTLKAALNPESEK